MSGTTPSRGRRLLSALGMLVAITLLVLVVHADVNHSHSKLAGPVPAPTGPAIAPTATSASSTTPTDASTASAPPPAVTTFEPFEGAQLPVSAVAGPSSLSPTTGSGFAPTAAGAAFAALHLSIRAVPDVGPSVFVPTIQRQVAGDAMTYLSDVEAAYAAAAARRGVAAGQPIQLATAVATGWKLAGFGLSKPVTVHVLLGSTGSPLLIDVPVTVIHTDSDWKLLPPPTGSFTGSPVASAVGYTPYLP